MKILELQKTIKELIQRIDDRKRAQINIQRNTCFFPGKQIAYLYSQGNANQKERKATQGAETDLLKLEVDIT